MSNNFDQKWSQLSKADQTAMKDKYDNKQGWQDAKARSEGFMNEQARRKNSGERHLKNNPDYVAPSTPPPKTEQTATSTNTAPTNNFNLSSNPNDSYEDIQNKYQTIFRNEKIFGNPEGRDVYEEAGLRNPSFLYDTPPGTGMNDWSNKYGGDRNEAFRAMGYHHDGYDNGWTKPDTLDRGTFNLDPEAYGKKAPEIFGETGQNPNDPDYNKTYDYSTQIPIMSNWGDSGQHKHNLEKNYGVSIEDLNKEIYPSRQGMYN